MTPYQEWYRAEQNRVAFATLRDRATDPLAKAEYQLGYLTFTGFGKSYAKLAGIKFHRREWRPRFRRARY